jgi:hypothetical protein
VLPLKWLISVLQPLPRNWVCFPFLLYLNFIESNITSAIISIIQKNVESNIISGFIKNVQKIHKSWTKEAKKSLKRKDINEDDENDILTEASPKEKKKKKISVDSD